MLEWSGHLAVDGREVLEVDFFPFDLLPRELYPIHVETIEDYRKFDGAFIVK